MNRLGDQIRKKRNDINMTQNALAKCSGISRSYICDVECGRYNPSLKTLTKISAALGMEIGDLVNQIGKSE